MQEAKENHFIKNIEIKNFKCFEDFKAEGFGRVNLIGGKNNVGKTAFMEAVFISSDINSPNTLLFINSFIIIDELRGLLDYNEIHNISDAMEIFKKFNNLKIKTDKFSLNLEVRTDMFEQKFLVNGRDTHITFDKAKMTLEKVVSNYFIPSYMIGDDLIVSIFNKIKEQRKREQLNKILNEFDKDILEFDIINDKPQVFLESSQKFQDVVELGHGLKRYIAIISSILINKDGFLSLDELENGIHHSKLDKLWNIILPISKQQNVQVFATTHSKECIESYARVAKRLDDREITYSVLTKLKSGKLLHSLYDYKLLETAIIEQKHEVR
jgi:AAA15 family ATPase/GTPase